jgi:hypothetical protein
MTKYPEVDKLILQVIKTGCLGTLETMLKNCDVLLESRNLHCDGGP